MIGLLLGGTVMGVVLGSVGALTVAVLSPVIGAVLWLAVVLVLAIPELAGRRLPLPQNARAVPQQIITADVVGGPLQFGFEMGTGVRTFMPSGVPHMVAAGVLLTGSPLVGVLAGLGFGLGRATMTAARCRHSQPNRWDDRLLGALRVLSVLAVTAALVCCLALVARVLLVAL